MALLVCGAEGEWALFNNTLTTVGSDDKRRGSVSLTNGQTMFKTYTGSDDIWAHIRLAAGSIASSPSSAQNVLQIRNATGEILAGLHRSQGATTDGLFDLRFIYATAADGSIAEIDEDYESDNAVFNEYDIRIQRSTVTNANDTLTISLYRNAQLRHTRTVTDATGWDQPSQILVSYSTASQDEIVYVQDVIVSDAIPTVGMELAVLVPSAVGNYSDFANDYTNIDDSGYDSSTVISTSTVDERESWIFSTPTFTLGDKVIYAVVLDTVAQTDLAAAISDFQPFLRISATDYAAANLGANNIAPDSFISIYTQNPATTAPWTQADLTALEAGIRAV